MSKSPSLFSRLALAFAALLLVALIGVALSPLGGEGPARTPLASALPAATYATSVPTGYPPPPTLSPVTYEPYPAPGGTGTATVRPVTTGVERLTPTMTATITPTLTATPVLTPTALALAPDRQWLAVVHHESGPGRAGHAGRRLVTGGTAAAP